MIDLHSHILPGIDDGAQTLEESIEMARIAVQSGIEVVMATPHCADDRTSEVVAAWRLLSSALKELNIPLQLGLGMEIFGSRDTVHQLQNHKLFTLNKSRYPLVEFRFRSEGTRETAVLQDLVDAGYTPLVAHPERYVYVQELPELLNDWKQMGCLLQVNRGSLLGRFGRTAAELSHDMVARGFVDVVASDAHSARFRTPWMNDVAELLSQEFGKDVADRLLRYNPYEILMDHEISRDSVVWF